MEREVSYVLMTAARNEEAYIDKTIQSVIGQTILPKKWVIVSDGSTDRTDEIAKHYASRHPFIQFVRFEPQMKRSFTSKVYAVREGLKYLKGIEYSFLGILDGDVSFRSDYYKRVLKKFKENPRLGIAGGILFEACNGKWLRQFMSSEWSVSGPIQMFRRECYEDIGGYIPMKLGGIDSVAEFSARMHGWKVQAFTDLKVFHFRRTGTKNGSILSARFNQGKMEFSHGHHPIFELAKCVYRIRERPYFVGSVFRMAGYCWACIQGEKRELPDDILRYIRKEQVYRLYSVLAKNEQK